MNKLKNNILITGSEGIIGKILVNNLSEFNIIRLDIKDIKSDNYYKINISNYESLLQKLTFKSKIDIIIHLAADHRVDANWESVLENNIIGTRNIYEYAKFQGINKVIFFSSNHITGGYEGFPPELHKKNKPKIITVNDPIRPDGYYASSKVFGEAIARQFYELYNIKSICLRIGTVLKNDNSSLNNRFIKTWLSHRDLIQLTKKSIKSNVKFGIYYGVSNNDGCFWDISNAVNELGYKPKDNAANLLNTKKTLANKELS